eukprot:5131304-Amphidinium_carterae.1
MYLVSTVVRVAGAAFWAPHLERLASQTPLFPVRPGASSWSPPNSPQSYQSSASHAHGGADAQSGAWAGEAMQLTALLRNSRHIFCTSADQERNYCTTKS